MKKWITEMVKSSWFRKIFSFLLALGWWWRTQISMYREQVFFNIPVIISNVPTGKQLSPDKYASQSYTRLALRGKKCLLDQVHSSNLRIVLDLSETQEQEVFHPIYPQNIYWHERPISEWANLRTIGIPHVQVTLLDQITTAIPINILLPSNWKDRVLAYAPSCFEQTVNATEMNIHKQHSIGLFWVIPEQLLQKAYDESLSSNTDEGVLVKLSPEHRLIYLPAIAKEPKVITDTKLSNIRLFFMPLVHKKEVILLSLRNLQKISKKELLTKSSHYELLPLTQWMSIAGVSPLVLEGANEHLFLDAHWPSKENLCLSLSIVHLLKWEEKFLGLYKAKMNQHKELSEEDIKKIGKKLFAHYLLNLRLDTTSIENVEKSFKECTQLAHVKIDTG